MKRSAGMAQATTVYGNDSRQIGHGCSEASHDDDSASLNPGPAGRFLGLSDVRASRSQSASHHEWTPPSGRAECLVRWDRRLRSGAVRPPDGPVYPNREGAPQQGVVVTLRFAHRWRVSLNYIERSFSTRWPTSS